MGPPDSVWTPLTGWNRQSPPCMEFYHWGFGSAILPTEPHPVDSTWQERPFSTSNLVVKSHLHVDEVSILKKNSDGMNTVRDVEFHPGWQGGGGLPSEIPQIPSGDRLQRKKKTHPNRPLPATFEHQPITSYPPTSHGTIGPV